MKINIPKPTKADKDLFQSLVPRGPKVTTRLMFGNDAAFVNGNLFFGIYGEDVFVRLGQDDSKELLGHNGSRAFEPMPGRPMTGYIVVPKAWRKKPKELEDWVGRSLRWAAALPAKKPKR